MDSADWSRLPSEVLELIAPLLQEHLPVARLTCRVWASELPRGTFRLRVRGAGPADWGTRLFSGLRELCWSDPQLLHCAPWRSLRTLTLQTWRDNTCNTDAALRLLFDSSPRFLSYLDVRSSNVTDAGLVGAPPTLTHLNIAGCTGITDAALSSLGHVKTLFLYGCNNLNGSGLGDLRSVTYLDVGSLNISNWQGLARLTSLTMLNAAGVKTGLRSLGESLSSVSSLTELHIGGTKDLSPVLHHLPSLHKLSLSRTRVSEASLSGLRNLEQLALVDCNYVGLAPLTKLQCLSMWQCGGVDDDSLLHMASLPSLLSISLTRGYGITWYCPCQESTPRTASRRVKGIMAAAAAAAQGLLIFTYQ